jgi:hypothetical protein
LTNDFIQITYDPKQLTPEKMLATIRNEGLEGNILADTAPANAPKGTEVEESLE